MLPSMMLEAYLPSSAADRFSTASGKRALRREVMVGLISRMCLRRGHDSFCAGTSQRVNSISTGQR